VINKENDDKKPDTNEQKESGFVDVAKMEAQCHILIKDKDTGEVLVNKRG
jgi:hypothetical protein